MRELYKKLFKMYGPQGWWPLCSIHDSGNGKNPTKTGSIKGYHPGDYSYPRTRDECFEICIGAILTQNTSWPNVEKALINLKTRNALSLKGIKRLNDGKLRELIKPAGYFNQKAKYIKDFILFFESLKGKTPTREELLEVKGIGKETADSMLLYGFKVPSFVIDAYTRRIAEKLGFAKAKDDYDKIKNVFEEGLEKDYRIYQEYHALLVEHAKRYYSKKPYGNGDPLAN